MKLRLFDIMLKAAILPGLIVVGGCASGEKRVTLSPVGPKANSSSGGDGPGHLIVYNTSHEAVNRDGSMAYPHDDYRIVNERNALVKRVRNVGGAEGEIPARVDLPPGEYTVMAQSEVQGGVAVPVIIKSGLVTKVNLQYPARTTTPISMASNY